MKTEDIARIIHISALSQLLIELTEDSIHEKEFKQRLKQTGNIFIKELDNKLNIMLDEDEAAEQILNYTTIVQEELKGLSDGIESELKKIIETEIGKNHDV